MIICDSGTHETEMGEDCIFEASLGYKVRSGVKNKQTTLGVESGEPPQILPRFTAQEPASRKISGYVAYLAQCLPGM